MTVRPLNALLAAAVFGALVAGAARGADLSSSKTSPVRPQLILRTDRILMLAADGPRAAVVTSKKRGCGQVVVWTAPARRVSRFGLGNLGCHFDGVGELALGGGQVAWIEEGGGNDLELALRAARLPRGRATQLDYDVNGDRAGGDPTGGWIGNLVGAGGLLAYNRWTVVCDQPPGYECGDGDPHARVTQERLVELANGRRKTSGGGPGVYSLAAAGGGRLAVSRADGVATMTATGAKATFVPDPAHTVRAVGLSAAALGLERKSTLDLYDPGTGALRKSIPLRSAASLQLVGLTQRYALLGRGTRIVLVRLSDGSAANLLPARAASSFVGARLTESGLFYAYDLGGARDPGRVAFVPARALATVF
jgi:hypothetical protein